MRVSLVFSACLLLLGTDAYAHPGQTNSKGCHKNRVAGSYHCHQPGRERLQKPKAQFEFLTENTQKHGSDKATIARIQMQLKRLGYDPGVVNGNLHKRTQGAVSKYRQDNGLADRKVSLSQLLSALSATPDDESLTPQDTDDDREGE